jgi:hypothetical protein
VSEVKLNLWQKINAVMQDVQYLAKDDKVEFGTTKYKAISEEKVTSSVRESLVKNGLVIMPIEQEHIKEGNLSTVNVKYKILNIENPQEFEIIASSGTGVDTQDKGVGKAMTYAYKYMLLRTFAIPTGEDPDKISSAELDAKLNSSKSDLNGHSEGKEQGNINSQLITENQTKRLYALSKGNVKAAKEVMLKHGYTESKQIKKSDYEAICEEIQKAVS